MKTRSGFEHRPLSATLPQNDDQPNEQARNQTYLGTKYKLVHLAKIHSFQSNYSVRTNRTAYDTRINYNYHSFSYQDLNNYDKLLSLALTVSESASTAVHFHKLVLHKQTRLIGKRHWLL
jgi:hypothetical protein